MALSVPVTIHQPGLPQGAGVIPADIMNFLREVDEEVFVTRYIAGAARPFVFLTMIGAVMALAACDRGDSETATEPAALSRGTLITVAESTTRDVPVVLESVGTVQSRAAPEIAAEVDGRVLRIAADAGDTVAVGAPLLELDSTPLRLERQAAQAEIRRIQAQIANEARRVKRFESLKQASLLSQAQLDDARAQLAVLREQLQAAGAQLGITEDQLGRTEVRSPLLGKIEQRFVSAGDYVKRGDPLFMIAGAERLRAFLPFPETVAAQIKPGLAVTLTSPVAPASRVSGVIAELRPMVGKGNRAVWAIVDLDNPGDWRPDATVVAEVVAAVHRGAVMVPEASVVRRPAGEVVYVIRDARAEQRVVSLGERTDGLVEVVSGLSAGEAVAAEGAAYLTDGAAVRMAEVRP